MDALRVDRRRAPERDVTRRRPKAPPHELRDNTARCRQDIQGCCLLLTTGLTLPWRGRSVTSPTRLDQDSTSRSWIKSTEGWILTTYSIVG